MLTRLLQPEYITDRILFEYMCFIRDSGKYFGFASSASSSGQIHSSIHGGPAIACCHKISEEDGKILKIKSLLL